MTDWPTRAEDRWVLPLGEGVVTQLQIDLAFGITVDAGLRFRDENSFVTERDEETTQHDPQEPRTIAPLVDLHGAVVTRAEVTTAGGLELAFDDGRTLEVEPDPQYEAFTVVGPGPGTEAFRFVSLPGGGLAEWTARKPG